MIERASLRRCLLGLALGLATLVARAEAPDAAVPAPGCPPKAEVPDPQAVQQAMRVARDRGFLWRIEKSGRSSYLFGTVHVARFDWMFPGPTVLRSLQTSDALALELDMLDPDIQRRMADGQRRADAKLPEPLAERLSAQMRAACIEPATLAAFSPEMQLAALTVLAARRDGLDPSYGIDIFLAGFGRGARKPIVSLETPEIQLAALQMDDPAQTLEFVASGLAELEAGRTRPMLVRIARIWAESDHDELMRYDEWCECRRTDAEREAMKRLLDDRNPALAERIDAMHSGGKRVFAAVGSLHMVGPLGLPVLLAQRGYRVERIAFAP